MAKTGIVIKVSDTVLGSPPQVNANSMLYVFGAQSSSEGTMPFALDTPYMIRSVNDLATLGITVTNNPDLYNQVSDFYVPTGGVNNSGTILWIVGYTALVDSQDATLATAVAAMQEHTLATTTAGFQYRPRNLIVSSNVLTVDSEGGTATVTGMTATAVQTLVDNLYGEGICTVALIDQTLLDPLTVTSVPDLVTLKAPMVGTVIFAKRVNERASVAAVGGWMASLTVGTSIGDSSLPQFGTSLYFTDVDASGAYKNTPCGGVGQAVYDSLGEKGYIFPRTRPPRNGLWINDGATANDPANALSTLEAGRTIASIVDDLRSFFTPYLNTKVPVNAAGDIASDYKQIVLDNARTSVIAPYIDNGDISDARIELVALNNDMVGTRTWEVTLAIQSSPTLRWIDGYVFYVKSL